MNKLLDFFEGRYYPPFSSWRYHLLILVNRWDDRSAGYNTTQLTSSVWDWTPLMVRRRRGASVRKEYNSIHKRVRYNQTFGWRNTRIRNT